MKFIDFEFTGLDNNYIKDNEIIQVKTLENRSQNIFEFSSKKKNTAGSYLCNRLESDVLTIPKFTKDAFEVITIYSKSSKHNWFGFGISKDIEMLRKYDIIVKPEYDMICEYDIEIIDIQDILRRTKYEKRLALEGCSLETCYFIVTGITPKINDHSGIEELFLMKEIYQKIKNLKRNEYLKYVPYGFCAGMPIEEYIVEFRRNADGYRFNNNDLFAKSLTFHIEYHDDEWEWRSDDDDE